MVGPLSFPGLPTHSDMIINMKSISKQSFLCSAVFCWGSLLSSHMMKNKGVLRKSSRLRNFGDLHSFEAAIETSCSHIMIYSIFLLL